MKELLERICRGAGAVLMERYRSGLEARDKTDAGWVTDADVRSEQLILEALRRATPRAAIVAEESGESGAAGELVWYVDPLDGTTNFARGMPFFAVSIGGATGGELRYAAVFDPVADELFYAERGRGAVVNERPLHIGTEGTFRRCVVATGDLYERGARFAEALRQQGEVYEEAMVVRAIGSVALSLAYVAAARLDGFFFDRCNTWDVAAGLLLVSEAGGATFSFDGTQPGASGGSPLQQGASVVAGSEAVARRLLALCATRGG